ncbi:MAG: DUF4156 domain-containing protein [Nitrosomonas sp.]|nr:DUF4156 domain-containing protein [Nitrosomonas sp.]
MKKLSSRKMIGAIIFCVLILNGCSAISVKPEANQVMIVTEKPDHDRCEFLGEVSGSQGNWLTGGYTSDENLIMGARNDLRNAAYKLGGNTVHVQHVSNSGRHEASGTSSSTIIGNAYNCR